MRIDKKRFQIFSLLVAVFLSGFTSPSLQAQPQFTLPIDCTIGTDCWVVNYMDVDPARESALDYQCGFRTYPEHHGTDFAVRDWLAMEKGVDVLAAADGKVARVRNEMRDDVLTRDELRNVRKQGRACGNGVLLDHGDGWQTLYCHMKQDSIRVQPGEGVKAGQVIGEVGHSGFTEFPHLHIGVLRDGKFIDPFTGLGEEAGCHAAGQSLWRKDLLLIYEPVSIYAAGFKDGVPNYDTIQRNASTPEKLSVDAPALTFWVILYGLAENDEITMEIRDGTGGSFAEQDIVQEKNRARQFYFIGRRIRDISLIQGTYTGIVKLLRHLPDGKVLTRELIRQVVIE